ncbi:MAG: glutamate 5-kinase [Deltaproteobacteria bacterium]|nr:MAG: glutamate 5-kinase [Deltaproteobacteria bacterium]
MHDARAGLEPVDPERATAAREAIPRARHIVVKIGSNVLLGHGRSRLDRRVFCDLVHHLAAALDDSGRRIVLVSSGAVALGRRTLAASAVPPPGPETSLTDKQALAALGQPALMHEWAVEFAHHDRRVAQILMSRDDFHVRERFLNARRTLRRLLSFPDVLPILNENDTLSWEELRLGDNDHLAALTTTLVEADLLVLLSDVSALHDADPREHPEARPIPVAFADDPALQTLCAPPDRNGVGTGGMRSKVDAARSAAAFGVPTVIASGKDPGVLAAVLAGQPAGTLLVPREQRLSARKAWLRFGRRAEGALRVDDGAVRALRHQGRSLLPRGITHVEGQFEPGAAVDIIAPDGTGVARGLAAYGSDDLRRIAGHHSDDIASLLGFSAGSAAVHRDDLVVENVG